MQPGLSLQFLSASFLPLSQVVPVFFPLQGDPFFALLQALLPDIAILQLSCIAGKNRAVSVIKTAKGTSNMNAAVFISSLKIKNK